MVLLFRSTEITISQAKEARSGSRWTQAGLCHTMTPKQVRIPMVHRAWQESMADLHNT